MSERLRKFIVAIIFVPVILISAIFLSIFFPIYVLIDPDSFSV